jgi:hypothetical protein
MIFDLGTSLGIKNHPVCRRAAVLLRLNDASLSRVLLAEALATGNAYSAATETIKLKRAFLKLPEVQEEYSIEKFKRLRSASDFSMRLALESTELKHSMLRHTDGLIGTSLTMLSPVISALAVMIFTHVIKPLEESSTQHPEVLLRNLLNIGRSCPIIRDEIFMQCLKQIRENPSEEYELRIWTILRACLLHFPPSHLFENYLESFLWLYVKSKPDLRTIIAAGCLRNMHQTIFLFGYNSKIFRPWDSSLHAVQVLLQSLSSYETTATVITTGVMSMGHGGSTSLGIPAHAPIKSSRNQQILYSLLDPAFVNTTNPTVGTNTSVIENNLMDGLKVSSQISVRGTRDNWIHRFNQLSQDEEDISMAEFSEGLFSSNSKFDRQDRIVFLFWVCKYLPSKGSALSILRELSSDTHLFYSNDPNERNRSLGRREFIRTLSHATLPTPTGTTSTGGGATAGTGTGGGGNGGGRLETQEMKFNAVKFFWQNVVCCCVSYELHHSHPHHSTPTVGTGLGSMSGSKSRDGLTPSRTILSHSMSDVVGLSDPRHRSSSISRNHPMLGATPPPPPLAKDLPLVPLEEAYITWPIYRDLVLVGMERIALEFEQLQEKPVTHDHFMSKTITAGRHRSNQDMKRSPSSVSPVSPIPPVAQRQRRHASHNKLPL